MVSFAELRGTEVIGLADAGVSIDERIEVWGTALTLGEAGIEARVAGVEDVGENDAAESGIGGRGGLAAGGATFEGVGSIMSSGDAGGCAMEIEEVGRSDTMERMDEANGSGGREELGGFVEAE